MPSPRRNADREAGPGARHAPPRWWERRWDYLQRELDEFRDLIRIRQVEGQDSVLINTQQQTLVRQLLRLRLLNARQALLARNDRLYRADLAEAQSLMNRYIDTRQAATASAAALIKQLASTPLSVDLPQIAKCSRGACGAHRANSVDDALARPLSCWRCWPRPSR
jgi:uncharacterized protein HemX